MFKVFRGGIEVMKSEMNEWLEKNPKARIKKMCGDSKMKGVLTVLVHYVLQGNTQTKQIVEIFDGDSEKLEQDMNSWRKYRPGTIVGKMRIVARGVDGDSLTAMIVYSQPEPEVC